MPLSSKHYSVKASSPGLAARSASGFMLYLAQSMVGKLFNLAAQFALAYLLAPEDFGLIGLAYTVMAFASVFGVGGVREVLIQKHRRWKAWAWPGLLVAISFGLAATLLALGLAPFGARFYGDPRLVGMVAILAASPLIQSVGVVPQARLQGQLRFRAAIIPNLLGAILLPALTVVFAALGFGAYSFALPVPIASLVVAIAAWMLAGPMPRYRLSRRHINAMAVSSGQLLGISFAYQFINQIDYIVVGRIAPTATVGQYYFSFNLSTQSLRLVVGNFTQVLLPVISQISDDMDRTRHAFVRVCRALALIGIPLSFAQAAFARPAFEAFLEPKWQPAIPILQVLSLGMGPRLLAGIADAALKGRGRFNLLLAANWIAAGSLLITLIIAATFWRTAMAIAAGAAVWSAAFGPALVWVALKDLGGGGREIVAIYLRPLLVALGGVGIAWLLIRFAIPESSPPLAKLVLGLTLSLLLIGLLAVVLCLDTLRELARMLGGRRRENKSHTEVST